MDLMVLLGKLRLGSIVSCAWWATAYAVLVCAFSPFPRMLTLSFRLR